MILGDTSRAHRLLHDKVGYSTVLMLCMLSIACSNVKLTKHSFLNSIRIWSGSELWQQFFFFFFKGERIQISQKAGHHRPASETPLNGVSLACWWWPNVECWLGSFWEFQGIRSSIAKKFYVFVIFQVGGGGGPDPLSPLWIRAWDRIVCLHLLRYTENPFYRPHRLLYDTLRTFYRSTSRERDACSFWISSFVNSESSSTYFKDSCISLQKNVLGWLYYIINGICADGEQAKSLLVFWRKNESVAIHR